MTSYCPVPGVLEHVPASNNYQPGFMAKMMLKDLHLSQHAARDVHLPLPLAELATELYTRFVAAGGAEQDFSAIIKAIIPTD